MAERKLPAGNRLHRGRYQLRYYGPGGKRTSETFDTLTAAKKRRRAVATDKDRGTWIDPQLARTPFSKWAQAQMDSRLDIRDSTRATDASYFRRHVAPAFSHVPVGRIGPTDIQAWVSNLSETLAPKTVRECYRLMSSIMRSAVDARLIAQSPCQGIRLPRVPRQEQRFLSGPEVDRLADSVGPRHRALVYCAAYLGCRWGELAGLKREHLDLLRRRVYVVGTLEEIGSRIRYLPETKSSVGRRMLTIPRFLVDVLAEHLAGALRAPTCSTPGRATPSGAAPSGRFTGCPPFDGPVSSPCAFMISGIHAWACSSHRGRTPKRSRRGWAMPRSPTTLNTYGHLLPSLDAALSERLDATYRDAKTGTDGDQMGTGRKADVLELRAGADG